MKDDRAPRRDRIRFWMTVGVAYASIASVLTAAGAPSAFLFAGIAGGAVAALGVQQPSSLPKWAQRIAMGLIGVKAGSMIDGDVAHIVAQQPIAIIGSILATLVVTLAAGQLLRLDQEVSLPTALFASIAGGASGLTIIARELHADDAVVVSAQYLRVLVVIFSIPLVGPLLDGAGAGSGAGSGTETIGWEGTGFTLLTLVIGLGLAQVIRFSACHLIIPMLVAIAMGPIPALSATSEVPTPFLSVGLAGIGLMVGLALTRQTLRRAARVMPLALATCAIGVPASALIGIGFAKVAGVSMFTGYLATSPGGLSAVIAFAIENGAEVGLVVTCQVLRLVLALLCGVLLGNLLERRGGGGGTTTPSL